MRMPRLLPLVAIAAGGVLAINAIENGPGIVGAARSFAEGVAPKSALPGPASALPPDATATLATSAQVVAAKPAPVCAESPTQLAKEAGLSPAELQVIQSLGARRGELDQREQGLSTELALIQAAEAKVDARIATMNGLKADMQTMVGQLDDKQQAEVDRLVKVFEAMINNKPQDAADRFVLLSDEVRLPIAAKMKERLLSAMIAKMTPPEAKRLTESLAARYAAQATAARAAINPPAAPASAAASAAAKPPPAAKTAKAAQAAPDQLQPVADAEPAPKTKPAVHRKPKVTKAPAKTVAAAKPRREDRGRGQAAGAGLATQAGGWRSGRGGEDGRRRPGARTQVCGRNGAGRGQDGRLHAGDQAGRAGRRAACQVRQLGPGPGAGLRGPGEDRLAHACGPAPARRRRRDRGAGDRGCAGRGRGASSSDRAGAADDPRRPGRGLFAHRVPLGSRRADGRQARRAGADAQLQPRRRPS